jgi:hypothetical protein
MQRRQYSCKVLAEIPTNPPSSPQRAEAAARPNGPAGTRGQAIQHDAHVLHAVVSALVGANPFCYSFHQSKWYVTRRQMKSLPVRRAIRRNLGCTARIRAQLAFNDLANMLNTIIMCLLYEVPHVQPRTETRVSHAVGTVAAGRVRGPENNSHRRCLP